MTQIIFSYFGISIIFYYIIRYFLKAEKRFETYERVILNLVAACFWPITLIFISVMIMLNKVAQIADKTPPKWL